MTATIDDKAQIADMTSKMEAMMSDMMNEMNSRDEKRQRQVDELMRQDNEQKRELETQKHVLDKQDRRAQKLERMLQSHVLTSSTWLYTMASGNTTIDLARWVRKKKEATLNRSTHSGAERMHSRVADLDYVVKMGKDGFRAVSGLSGEIYDRFPAKGDVHRQPRNEMAHGSQKNFAHLLQMPEYAEERHLWEAVFPLVYGKSLDELAAEQVAEFERRRSKSRMALTDESDDETPLAPARDG
ncbi:MAG: hypothetical protein M1826_003201 [Phylliscum demangeonii]|nr:MAG: hypothetical protein M1826_003201 [Phylliscum demangeonii]